MSSDGATSTFPWLPVVQLLRPVQWVKNLLVFVPILLAHEVNDPARLGNAAIAFIAFCCASSAGYALNDLRDVRIDRRHPDKKRRPFARGSLPVSWAPALILVLLSLGFGLSLAALPGVFALLLTIYVLAQFAYCFWIKSIAVVDVLTLAAFYAVRLLAGGVATDTRVSAWLLAFALFFFTSLAFAKRHAELSRLEAEGEEEIGGRGYEVGDLSLIESMGLANGYLAVLVLALYVNSDKVNELYPFPAALWLVCPLLLFWVSRVWFLARRRSLSEDPVIFALTDRVSWIVGILALTLLALAALGGKG